MKSVVFKVSGLYATFKHIIIVKYGHVFIMCQIVNIWDQHYISSDPNMELHHWRMWNVVWLLGCLFRHCNVTTGKIATSLEPRGQEAHQTRVWAQPIDRNIQNFGGNFTKKMGYILNTSDHECDVHTYVSKCELSIGGFMRAEMVSSRFKIIFPNIVICKCKMINWKGFPRFSFLASVSPQNFQLLYPPHSLSLSLCPTHLCLSTPHLSICSFFVSLLGFPRSHISHCIYHCSLSYIKTPAFWFKFHWIFFSQCPINNMPALV